jgi:hypothetical protein
MQEDLFMLYVGIDQHRKQLTVHVRDDQGEVVLEEKTGATLCLALFVEDRGHPLFGFV